MADRCPKVGEFAKVGRNWFRVREVIRCHCCEEISIAGELVTAIPVEDIEESITHDEFHARMADEGRAQGEDSGHDFGGEQ